MKKIAMLLVVLAVVGLASFASAAEKESVLVYEVGEKGYIKYPWLEDEIALWPTKEMNGAGYFSGIIDANTKINVVNKKVGRQNLDLLNGKPALVYARMKQVGHGEGSKTHCLSLTIFVLSETDYRIPVTMTKKVAQIEGLNGQSVGASRAVKGLDGLVVK